MEDFLDPRNAEGMPDLADSAIAMDFLMTVKTGVRTYAMTLTESESPELRNTLRSQMEKAIALHGELSDLMMKKGWFYPYELKQQIHIDVKAAETAVQIAGLKLFTGDTDRRGMFATPNQ